MILLPLIFSFVASSSQKKATCGRWDVRGSIATKADRFDRLIAQLQTSKDPDADLSKFATREGLPFALPIYDGTSVPQNRLEFRSIELEDDRNPYEPKPKKPIRRGEYIVFAKTLPPSRSGSIFYEFTNPQAKKPLRKWIAPDVQGLPGNVEGDEMIFKISLQALCGSKNFWETGVAVKPNGNFRIVPYKNDQYPSIVSNCHASSSVFESSPFNTCGEVTDSKKNKRLLVYQLTKD